jgi:chromate transporter
VPVTAGLVTASAIVITHTSVSGWGTALIAALVAIATTTTRIHPLLALAAGAALGLTGIGQP